MDEGSHPIGKTIYDRFKFQLVIPWSAVISNPPQKRSLHRSMILFKEGTDVTLHDFKFKTVLAIKEY